MTTLKNPLLTAIGAQIRQLRVGHGFSQEDFARRAGLDRAYYGGVERGERNISAINLARIAIALGVEMGELFPPVTELSELIHPPS